MLAQAERIENVFLTVAKSSSFAAEARTASKPFIGTDKVFGCSRAGRLANEGLRNQSKNKEHESVRILLTLDIARFFDILLTNKFRRKFIS